MGNAAKVPNQETFSNCRVLFLAFRLGAGGVTSHMLTLGKGLQRRGCKVAVLSRGRYGDHLQGPEQFEASGIPHYSIEFPAGQASLVNLLLFRKAIAQVRVAVRDFRPDLLHVHWRLTSVYARLVEVLNGVPFVSTLHHFPIPAVRPHRMLSFWGRRAIATGAVTLDGLRNGFRVPRKLIREIRLGVDDHYFRPATEEERSQAKEALGLTPEQRVVCVIGRLEFVKGHDVLIDALAILRRSALDLVALISGGGDGRASIASHAERAGVDDLLRFLGWYPSVRDVFWASDAFVLTSREEGFGLVVVEAMLCGLVPIRTPTGGAEEQIEDGVSGFIVPFDDPETLADRLQKIFTCEALKNDMAETALESARRGFRADRMVEETLSVYQEVLSEVATSS